MEDIYGIDPNGEVVPEDVRNALVECFTLAHGNDLAESLNIDITEDSDNAIQRESIVTFLKGAFDYVGADFDKPTKDGLMKVVKFLEEFSKNFRDPEIIAKHAGEIMKLIKRLD